MDVTHLPKINCKHESHTRHQDMEYTLGQTLLLASYVSCKYWLRFHHHHYNLLCDRVSEQISRQSNGKCVCIFMHGLF